jgi:hypothetical protein
VTRSPFPGAASSSNLSLPVGARERPRQGRHPLRAVANMHGRGAGTTATPVRAARVPVIASHGHPLFQIIGVAVRVLLPWVTRRPIRNLRDTAGLCWVAATECSDSDKLAQQFGTQEARTGGNHGKRHVTAF